MKISHFGYYLSIPQKSCSLPQHHKCPHTHILAINCQYISHLNIINCIADMSGMPNQVFNKKHIQWTCNVLSRWCKALEMSRMPRSFHRTSCMQETLQTMWGKCILPICLNMLLPACMNKMSHAQHLWCQTCHPCHSVAVRSIYHTVHKMWRKI